MLVDLRNLSIIQVLLSVYLGTIVSRSTGGSTGTSGSNRARCTTLTRESSITLRVRSGRELDWLVHELPNKLGGFMEAWLAYV